MFLVQGVVISHGMECHHIVNKLTLALEHDIIACAMNKDKITTMTHHVKHKVCKQKLANVMQTRVYVMGLLTTLIKHDHG